MEIFRIQNKIISWEKIDKTLKKALSMRARDFPSRNDRLNIDVPSFPAWKPWVNCVKVSP